MCFSIYSAPTLEAAGIEDIHQVLVNGAVQANIATSNSGSSGRSTPKDGGDCAPGKLFVGGLSWQTSAEKLKEYFGTYGHVTDVLIMKDPATQVNNFFNIEFKTLYNVFFTIYNIAK